MEGFKKPNKKAVNRFQRYLFIDGEQVVNSLSSIEGGSIGEARGRTLNEGNSDRGIDGSLGMSGSKVKGDLSKGSRFEYEEEVVRERTGYSKVDNLLQHLREEGSMGFLPGYTPEIYGDIEEGELYEFRANIRLHPFHQLVSAIRGWEHAGQNLGENDEEFAQIANEAEDFFYGKGKSRKRISVFADMENSFPDYKIALQLEKEQLLVDLEEFQGEATFVAQIHRKIKKGQKVPAARLVRDTPLVAPAEEKMMLSILPAFQNAPGAEEIALNADQGDVILKYPAMIVKPLCIYKG